jgi:methylglyoxal synthase
VARRLALIAHDHKKVDIIAWATFNRDTLASFSLIATRHTARLVRDKVGLEVEELLSGPEGGDAQIAARVATEDLDVVLFFVDPLWAQPHDPDIRALSRPIVACPGDSHRQRSRSANLIGSEESPAPGSLRPARLPPPDAYRAALIFRSS